MTKQNHKATLFTLERNALADIFFRLLPKDL